jgi:proteasome lid subunit RPN8/RPN11
MTIRALKITAVQRDTLSAAARAAFPHEVCGLLIGAGEGTVVLSDLMVTPNIAADPARRFEIDPQVQFETLRRLRGTAQRIVGHFHSHPNGTATLSAHDLAVAYDPDAIWVVIPVTAGAVGDARAFVCPTSDKAEPIPIIDGEG